jgi:hypothetical protein
LAQAIQLARQLPQRLLQRLVRPVALAAALVHRMQLLTKLAAVQTKVLPLATTRYRQRHGTQQHPLLLHMVLAAERATAQPPRLARCLALAV